MDRQEHTASADHETSEAGELAVAVKRAGEGPPLFLLHGGMGSWTHWARNIDALAEHFSVMALDHPGYGDAPSIDRAIDPEIYLDVVQGALETLAPGDEPINIAGFSFGAAIGVAMAGRLGDRVRRLSLIGAAGFEPTNRPKLPMRSYKEARGDDAKFREVMRHNLLVLMLKHPESVDEETLDMQYANVTRARFNSRRVSRRPELLGHLARTTCEVQMIWGDHDPVAHPSVEARAEMCRAVKPGLRVDLVKDAGHWTQYEAADEVNRLLLDFLLDDRD
jgi:pimeloyl-ACP methyl ester carboxylesterase